ncbi:MAG: TerC family protein [Candidatus Omnitrophica bacterium]|nr:TerC family protein [Candidatus Omnitrophota bacterium]
MNFSKAVLFCSIWIVAALLFNAGIYIIQGQQKSLEFLTSYIIELSLSVDNLFVFYLIFSQLKISNDHQSKILTWGVLGAQLMRGILILGGIALLQHLSWIIYAFGFLLIFSGVKIFTKTNKTINPDRNIALPFFHRFIPVNFSSFLTALILVEIADLIFSMDSIPAVLAVSKDPFIVYTSNIFAILGLRAMYFIIGPIINKFHYLHYGLGIILVFVGIKMITENFLHIPVCYTLGFIALTLGISILASLSKSSSNPHE